VPINIDIRPITGKHTFEYLVQIGTQQVPATPTTIGVGSDLINSIGFGVELGDRLAFESDHPFVMFFRYGRPDRGDFQSTDEEKQIRSQLQNGRHRTSIRALLQGLYDPVVILFNTSTNEFIYDRGLGFEVHPAGA
jgi:hypothetical protein